MNLIDIINHKLEIDSITIAFIKKLFESRSIKVEEDLSLYSEGMYSLLFLFYFNSNWCGCYYYDLNVIERALKFHTEITKSDNTIQKLKIIKDNYEELHRNIYQKYFDCKEIDDDSQEKIVFIISFLNIV